jgi:hypothetical protein
LFLSPDSGLHRRRFIPHAALLRQACAHCGRFVAAASRRSPGSVSVPMWRVVLSHPLPVFGLVGHYPANYLIGRSPLPRRQSFAPERTYEYYRQFPTAIPYLGARSIGLLTLPPLVLADPLDLHALAMPPAFNLSQDQTLQLIIRVPARRPGIARNADPEEITKIDPENPRCSPPPLARLQGTGRSTTSPERPAASVGYDRRFGCFSFLHPLRSAPLARHFSRRVTGSLELSNRNLKVSMHENAAPRAVTPLAALQSRGWLAKPRVQRCLCLAFSRSTQLFTFQGNSGEISPRLVAPAFAAPRFRGRGYRTTHPSPVNCCESVFCAFREEPPQRAITAPPPSPSLPPFPPTFSRGPDPTDASPSPPRGMPPEASPSSFAHHPPRSRHPAPDSPILVHPKPALPAANLSTTKPGGETPQRPGEPAPSRSHRSEPPASPA